jgi:hypothetical protein
VKTVVASQATSISSDAIERRSKWAFAEADRIDPIKTVRFLENIEVGDNPKQTWMKCGACRTRSKIDFIFSTLRGNWRKGCPPSWRPA